ncbi:MAG: hypothetical protein IKQ55_02850 [Kiritimatiellae bacterium]|nr:hypothetical protein [Kiritimatiellia bacterium]
MTALRQLPLLIPCAEARQDAAPPRKARRAAGSRWWLAAVAGIVAWGATAGARGDVLAEVAGFFGVGRRWLGVEDFSGVHACGVPEEAPERLVLSGMVFHSALGIEAVKTRAEGDVLLVEVRAGLARKGVDGNLNESIALPDGIREVQFGRGRTVVWSRRVADTWRKLGEIVVPKVECVNTAPGDVLEYVRGMVAYATGEEEPEFEVEWEDAVGALPPVTLTLERASARDILRAVDEALGVHTELKADGSGWVVRRVIRLEDAVEIVPPTGGGEGGE